MHPLPVLVAQASAVGLVSTREVLDGVVGVRDESRSNHVHAILVGNRPVAYVKERGPASTLDGEDVIGRERRALRCLIDLDCAPRLLTETSDDALWLGAVRGADLTAQHGNVPELAEICQAWGAELGRLHRIPVRPGASVAPRPWVLSPAHRAPSMRGAPAGSAFATVLAAIEAEPGLRAAAAEVDQRWSETHWIHGDVSPTNVVVDTLPCLQVRFLDFEDAGLGDPAWDLATALDTIGHVAPGWAAPVEPLTEYFLRGYRHADGPGRLYPAMQAVRAVATAWQLAGLQGGAEPSTVRVQVADWLRRARGHAAAARYGARVVA
jgi:aminoglycoside phosphotransferase (APT) family kinase protein